ncbi:MAG TPA: cytochrome c oxidase subunit II [Chitinophagaceae bacterium]|nr:cytochrome c oxidase subunit II [Chitinophagaceae bacterium]
MQTFFIILILLLGFLITFQIAKASEYVSVMRGEEKSRKQNNRINAFLLLVFLILGMIGVYYCNERLAGKILQFGSSASDHGLDVDNMLKITIIITGIVFFITQGLLFWFSFKYQASEKRKAFFFPHNNRLEVIWTVIPAIVLTVMVGFGLFYWFRITGEAPKNAMEVEIVGSQFKWEYRYPGKDKILGKKFYKQINEAENNPLGQLWEDPANHDDIYISGEDLHLVVNKPVRLVINAKDVIHDVGLAHFRMKMDAVPGTPTTMWFTPIKTTAQMKKELNDPDFVYEISCDQMCGKGHYSMRGTIIVESQEEFDRWMATKKPKYFAAFPDKDPDAVKITADTTKQLTQVLPESN